MAGIRSWHAEEGSASLFGASGPMAQIPTWASQKKENYDEGAHDSQTALLAGESEFPSVLEEVMDLLRHVVALRLRLVFTETEVHVGYPTSHSLGTWDCPS